MARADGIGLASDADYHRRSAETETQPRSDFTGGSLDARGKHEQKKGDCADRRWFTTP